MKFWFLLLVCAGLGLPAVAASFPIIKVGVDQSTEPFSDEKSQGGLEVDVIRAAFKSQGIDVAMRFMSNARLDREFEAGRVDMHTAAYPAGPFGQRVLTRWPITSYRNQAISLKERGLRVAKISDLRNYRVLAWQGASNALGSEFKQLATANPKYSESANLPVRMLLLNRVDVVISQPDIFRAALLKDLPDSQKKEWLDKVAYADVLPQRMRYWYAFNDPTLRDALEKGLASIYQSGEIDRIMDTYLDTYGTSRDLFIELDCRFGKPSQRPKCPVSN